jgi:hypothetical protein
MDAFPAGCLRNKDRTKIASLEVAVANRSLPRRRNPSPVPLLPCGAAFYEDAIRWEPDNPKHRQRRAPDGIACKARWRAGDGRVGGDGGPGSPKPQDVEGRHAESGRGAMLPLREDLADDLRKHVARKGGAADTPLFHLDRNFLRTFNLDLAAAGIPKRDAFGRTVDVHSLRHTFATLLARGGVMPTVARKLMRHSDIRLTMNTYTHLELADAAGAVAGLGGV